MKKSLLFLNILFLYSLAAGSQALPCGNGRFGTRVFSNSIVTSSIQFGRNVTYAGVTKNLFMDVYEPAGDPGTIRPLFIFVFGGAFVGGDRTQLAFLCDSMARKGYVAAAIDYRLYDSPLGVFGLILNPNDGIDAVAKGMSDIKAAIRYFKRDAATTKTFRIDSTNIFLGGISSGSIAALHTAYINTLSEAVPPVSTIITNNGGMEGNTDLPGTPLINTYSFKGIRGVWNMSGALYDSGYIKAGDPALFGVHGTADGVVPFGYGQLFNGSTNLGSFACGSSSLNNQALNVGVPTKFIPVIGGDHETMYYDPANQVLIDTTGSKFFGNLICPILPITGGTLKGNIINKHIELSWQTLTEANNKGFAIEKQTASGWVSLGEIRSKAVNGNSNLPLNYTFDDIQPQQGSNIYRFKTISFSGEIEYSNIVRISWNDKSAPVFVIYPNPVGYALHFKTILSTNEVNTLKIYTADMRLVQTSVLNASQTVPVSNLARGLYLGIVYDAANKQTGSGWFMKE